MAQTVEKKPLLHGQRFGRWTVLDRAEDIITGESKTKVPSYLCVCDCGTFKIVRKPSLLNGKSKSCICLAQDVAAVTGLTAHKTHGMSTTRVYKIWSGMVKRCTNENEPSYKHYGGNGVTVNADWLTFENFFSDMGEPLQNQSLDRIDSSIGYSKENCRWADDVQQNQNAMQRKDNTSGRTGVYYDKATGLYKVMLWANKKAIPGGYFSDFEDAVKKREQLEAQHHGRTRPESYSSPRKTLETEGEYHQND